MLYSMYVCLYILSQGKSQKGARNGGADGYEYEYGSSKFECSSCQLQATTALAGQHIFPWFNKGKACATEYLQQVKRPPVPCMCLTAEPHLS